MSAYAIQERFFKGQSPELVKKIHHEVQFDFFLTEKESEIEMLVKQMADVKESSNRVRKKLFAENGNLKMKLHDLEERLQILERNICLSK